MYRLKINSIKHGFLTIDKKTMNEINLIIDDCDKTKPNSKGHFGWLAWNETIPEIKGTIDSNGVVIIPNQPERIVHHEATVSFEIEDVTEEYTKKYIENVVNNAKDFGSNLVTKFSVENILLGITQDQKTNHVRKTMSEVLLALSTGSLHDAIAELKAIPNSKKDSKYLTNARILKAINEIETYLNLPLTEGL